MADLPLPADDSTGWGSTVRAAITLVNKHENTGIASVVVVTGDEPRPVANVVIWVGGATQPTNMAPTDLWASEAVVDEEPPDEEEPPVEEPIEGFVQRTTFNEARNGTTSHTLTFAPATAGNLLVAVAAAGAVISLPGAWTRVAMSLDGADIGVWTKTATAGESSVVATLSAANYALIGAIYEAPSNVTFHSETHNLGVHSDPNPTLSGLTGTNITLGIVGRGYGGDAITEVDWTGAVEDFQFFVPPAGTDGVALSVAYVAANTATSFAPTGAITGTAQGGKQSVTLALKIN